jgi:hypothetical protein
LRHLLYISPFFPPLRRIGALRPLKFARHLPEHGWIPVVLCDLWDGAPCDRALLDAVPKSTIVLRRYSSRAEAAEAKYMAGPPNDPAEIPERTSAVRTQSCIEDLIRSKDWLPMGDAIFHVRHALKAARQALKQHPCDAIMVNADPVAALLVGKILARETGLPFIADLRDPWGPCELRRPRRPFYTRLIEVWCEHGVVTAADKVILNTETARAAYLRQYSDVDPNRFTVIRNHLSRALIAGGGTPGFNTFTLLFLGSFSAFVRPEPLLRLLAALKARGVTPRDLQMAITATLDPESRQLARMLDIEAYVIEHPTVQLRDVGALMEAADMLVLFAPTPQRIQAKFYDYLGSERPILAISKSHPELAGLLQETGAGSLFAPDQTDEIATYIEGFLMQGRHPVVPRNEAARAKLESPAATQQLAAILDEVTNTRRTISTV